MPIGTAIPTWSDVGTEYDLATPPTDLGNTGTDAVDRHVSFLMTQINRLRNMGQYGLTALDTLTTQLNTFQGLLTDSTNVMKSQNMNETH